MNSMTCSHETRLYRQKIVDANPFLLFFYYTAKIKLIELINPYSWQPYPRKMNKKFNQQLLKF